MNGILYLCLNSFLIFYVSKSTCFERKTKIAFFKDGFDIWIILG